MLMKGWEYRQRHPTDGADACCGQCFQTGCVDRSVVRALNENWRLDECSNATCVARDNAVRLGAAIELIFF